LGVATRWHLMTPPQEMPYTIVNVMIDRLVRSLWLANCYGRANFTGAAQVNWLSLSERIR